MITGDKEYRVGLQYLDEQIVGVYQALMSELQGGSLTEEKKPFVATLSGDPAVDLPRTLDVYQRNAMRHCSRIVRAHGQLFLQFKIREDDQKDVGYATSCPYKLSQTLAGLIWQGVESEIGLTKGSLVPLDLGKLEELTLEKTKRQTSEQPLVVHENIL